MLRKVDTPRYEAFLAGYRLPSVRFEDSPLLPASMRPVWTALQADVPSAAVRNVEQALAANRLFSAEDKAGLLMGKAAAQLRMEATDEAWENARRSLDLFPHQEAAQRIQIVIHSRKRRYEEAYDQLLSLETPSMRAIWDTRIDATERHLALASLSWLTGEWERVAGHIEDCYPDGLTSMPDEIQEDWFRLALYRDRPEDAAAAAELLIPSRAVNQADEMLQTIVQSGWYSQALPLYKDAFSREPGSELLRRRLVALCIKEGDLEEARRLTAPGALRTAA